MEFNFTLCNFFGAKTLRHTVIAINECPEKCEGNANKQADKQNTFPHLHTDTIKTPHEKPTHSKTQMELHA